MKSQIHNNMYRFYRAHIFKTFYDETETCSKSKFLLLSSQNAKPACLPSYSTAFWVISHKKKEKN